MRANWRGWMGGGCRSKQAMPIKGHSPAASSALRPRAKRPGARGAAHRSCGARGLAFCHETAVCLRPPHGACRRLVCLRETTCPHPSTSFTVHTPPDVHWPASRGNGGLPGTPGHGIQPAAVLTNADGQHAARSVREGDPAHTAPARGPKRSQIGALPPRVSCAGHEQRRRGSVPSHRPMTAAWAGQRHATRMGPWGGVLPLVV